MRIFFVTGNANKVREVQTLAPEGIELAIKDIDLPEIQSLDLREIISDKARRAYEAAQAPVIVEDVSAGLDDMAGLPGPFYKFFSHELGDTVLVKLAGIYGDRVTVRCLAAYYDGEKLLVGEGVIKGKVVEPRGGNGFGFDPVICPDGWDRTMAEMTAEEKNIISHRGLAFKNLFEQLQDA